MSEHRNSSVRYQIDQTQLQIRFHPRIRRRLGLQLCIHEGRASRDRMMGPLGGVGRSSRLETCFNRRLSNPLNVFAKTFVSETIVGKFVG